MITSGHAFISFIQRTNKPKRDREKKRKTKKDGFVVCYCNGCGGDVVVADDDGDAAFCVHICSVHTLSVLLLLCSYNVIEFYNVLSGVGIFIRKSSIKAGATPEKLEDISSHPHQLYFVYYSGSQDIMHAMQAIIL